MRFWAWKRDVKPGVKLKSSLN